MSASVSETKAVVATRRWRFWLAGLLAGLVAVVAVLELTRGGISGLSGEEGLNMWGGIPVLRGQPADFTAFLYNRSGRVITLESARLIPLPGFRRPRYVGVAVQPGGGFFAAGRGWLPLHQSVTLTAFRGYRLQSGHRAQILYGVVSSAFKSYAALGVSVTVRAGSQTAVVPVYGPGYFCVVPRLSGAVSCPASFVNRFSAAIQAKRAAT